MSNEIIIALLSIGCISALAAFFVAWAKADEYKHMAKDERECYEAMRRMYSGLSALAQEKDDEIEEQRELLMCCERKAEFWFYTTESVVNERDALQDRLSALLCPMNDHVWKDGVCVKCWRVQE